MDAVERTDAIEKTESAERQQFLQLITKKLVILTSGSMVIVAIIFYLIELNKGERAYLVFYVFLTGVIGGFVSIQQRLPEIGLSELRELSTSLFTILLIPINGGIFAMVLMAMFVSGILEGALFPRYIHAVIDRDDLVYSFVSWLKTTFPASGPDIAKLLFWSFVAGFSERFVPQIIRKTAESDNGK
jgi:hypothetical protein